MRARGENSRGGACARPLESAAARSRSILLPVATAAALAVNVSVAAARPSDRGWDGPRLHAKQQFYQQHDDDDDEVRPRRPSGRSLRGTRHGSARSSTQQRADQSQRRAKVTGRGRGAAPTRSASRKTPLQGKAQIASRSPGANPEAQIIALEQRSLVAAHPLLPDPPPADHAAASATASSEAAPRCRRAHHSAFSLALASFGPGFKPTEPAMVEGAWPHCRGARNPQSDWRLASLGPTIPGPARLPSRSLSGGSIRWIASAACLASPLRAVLGQVAARFGPLTVNSTCRSRSHNRRVGGASRSYHLTGNAVDFRVRGSFGAVHAFLARQHAVGGLKHYGSGVFHIDTGPRRTWGGRRTRYARG